MGHPPAFSAPRPRRGRGYDMLQISLGIAIVLGLMIGGLMLFKKTYRDMTYNDIAIATQYLRGKIWTEASMGTAIAEGEIPEVYYMELPGFQRVGDTFHHKWADTVSIRHAGAYVVEMTLSGLDEVQCQYIAKHAADYLDGSYQGYLTIGGSIYSDPEDPVTRASISSGCEAEAGAEIGWVFATSETLAAARTGHAWADGP
ncbi:hypothetical protein OCH239_10885 [Roseivivax halodurans JCM 10272]|uniref:Type 4 secretion system PilS N-terminal domain-containing protein n=1 Tax=Roseivivax halodurans JCM 10272 TaxID=1449350 RepID=X7EBV5_9RHOB|nr:hypothetical protein [Roseivivax halodurans]ETX13340.1 hypothetical protein OCH239_10885 [Roseivivax halodurans JCM 10272]